MNLLVYYQYFGTPKGGWSTRVYEFAKRWVAQGHKVTVVTSPYYKSDITASKRVERQNVEGINLIVINYADSNKFSKLKRMYNFLMFSLFSIWFGLTEKYDIALASSGPITVGLPAIIAKWFRRKKYIFEVRDVWPEGAIQLGVLTGSLTIKLALWFEKRCYLNAQRVVVCSEGMRENIIKRFPLLKNDVIPNSCDNQLFGELAVNLNTEDKHIFLYAGSIGLMDDCQIIIDAAQILQKNGNKNVQIVIIGDGADKEDIELQVKNKQLKNVEMLGLLPKTEVVKWFSKAIASFVMFKSMPVLDTVSPNKMFDSFAAGVPILQNTQGWIKTLVEKEKCGLNISQDSPEDLAQKIQMICDDEELVVNLSANAKRMAEDLFNRDKLAVKYIQNFKMALDNE